MSNIRREESEKICTTPECGAWSRDASDLIRCKQCGRTQAISRAGEPDAVSLKEASDLGWCAGLDGWLCPTCVEAENERRKKYQNNWWWVAMAAGGCGAGLIAQSILRGENPFCSRVGVEIAGGTLEKYYWGASQ